MKPDESTKRFRLFHAEATVDGYASPEPLPFSTGEVGDVDPAMAPDESFLVFGSGRKPAQDMDLFIVFKTGQTWGEPTHLGNIVNTIGSDAEARLGPDHQTLYFSSERLVPQRFPRSRINAQKALADANSWNNGLYNIWTTSLAPWLDRHAVSKE